MTFERNGSEWAVEGSWYRLSGTVDGPVARLADADGRSWAELRLLASLDTRDGADETFTVTGPDPATVVGGAAEAVTRLTWALTGSRWAAKRLVLDAAATTVTAYIEVEGRGALTEVSLLAGRVVQPRASGMLMSGAWFESVVSAAPADPSRIVQPASESSVIGVVSGAEPGRGRWFFTPAPFVVAAARAVATSPSDVPDGPWLVFAVDATAGNALFTEVAYRAMDRGFAFVLDYDGQTVVDGTWRSPPLVIATAPDPFTAVADQQRRLEHVAPARRPATVGWWREPMFCGWGAQSALVAGRGLPMSAAPSVATAASYDAFLDHLEAHGVVPGTIVVDDKWQLTYGGNEPDAAKWPDLRGWIAARRRRRQRVLLWYKAWDPEGLPDEWCVRSAAGTAIAIDPTNPDAEAAIRQAVRTMIGPDGLDADGLKIDFTARTPSGRATVHHGPEWGVDLLGRLLGIVADEAHSLKPDALLIGHAPNHAIASSLDMIRLNDALRLDDPAPAADVVTQMRFRAGIVRAACPDHLIDTDDWCMPDLAGWRAYTAVKAQLGVPALYYATGIDRTGEAFEERDYELIRTVWADYRQAAGLPPRRASD
ncbi:MAG: hypothetical protein QOF49_823 [Chloroflexota bacterium]|jgi:hypothetical protein|nr:hypothetical protein [Chloroflexota bacterium]